MMFQCKLKMAKLRFFDAVGDELGNWFKANYSLEDVSEGVALTVLNLKDVMVHFKEFAGSKTAVGAFNNAIIRMCGKRVEGGAGYFINRNDHMLQGYVRIVDAIFVVIL
jgi:hypothetical protein